MKAKRDAQQRRIASWQGQLIHLSGDTIEHVGLLTAAIDLSER